MKSDSLANYQIKNPIGRGAGSFVCKIVNRLNKVEMAAKIIQKTSSNAQKIQNEVDIHLELHHKNVVHLTDIFEDDDNSYLIMELCDSDIYQLIKKEQFSEQQIRYYGKQLAEGLQYLHSHNIIHRDIKLGNLLIQNDILKIADFGLAVKLNNDEEERSTLCGTPNYISPEILNQQPYGKKVDLWSMGCCLYAMATGHGPFEEKNTPLGEVLRRVKVGDFDLPNNFSEVFKDLIINLLNLDADQRYSIEKIIKHPFFIEPIPPRIQSRNQSSSQIKQLLDLSPFVKHQHRQTCSMIGLEKQQIVASFLQKQQQLGGKKLLFGMTTNCKGGLKQNYHLENVPRFFLPQESHSNNTSCNHHNKENINKENCNKENIRENSVKLKKQNSSTINIYNESPIKLEDLKSCKLQTKNGLLQIHEDGRFEMDVCNKDLNFIIQTNGQEILVQKKGQKPKQYRLNELPQKLQKFYTYSKQVCNAIRERNQKHKITNEHGNFALKNTKLGQCFEGYIAQSKIKIQYILNSDTLKLQLQNGTLKSININEFQQMSTQARMDPNEVYSIKIALKYLTQCQQ
ncbi:unnamed protein product [Paramecium primaurelia]|uniref:Non-specific serine/threonine protein kinase n=1 Tax=Paramecium primaurelia TaxID=5886 RepID=A0A8S1JSJ5_PARPR|nr:unnamed protein product [Paramecium primaurelia]